MFYGHEEMLEQLEEIEDAPGFNKVAFIIAPKGFGKTHFVEAACAMGASRGRMRVDGGKAKGIGSPLKGCFIDGIIRYLNAHNCVPNRSKVANALQRCGVSSFRRAVFVAKRKIDTGLLTWWLSSLSVVSLCSLYLSLSNCLPLTLLVFSPFFAYEDVYYLKNLPNQSLRPELTIVIVTRPNRENLSNIRAVLKVACDCLVLPLADCPPDPPLPNQKWCPDILRAHAYRKGHRPYYDVMRQDCHQDSVSVLDEPPSGSEPLWSALLAHQSVPVGLVDLFKNLGWGGINQESRLVVQCRGELVETDALACILVMDCLGGEAFSAVQAFFVENLSNLSFGFSRGKRRRILNVLRFLHGGHRCSLIGGYAGYYADFAGCARFFIKAHERFGIPASDMIGEADRLDSLIFEWNDGVALALMTVYERAPFCGVLETGLNCLRECCELVGGDFSRVYSLGKAKEFIGFALDEAYRWLDLTLIDGVALVIKKLVDIGVEVEILASASCLHESKACVHEYYKEKLEECGLRMGEVMKYGSTIFLSYCHQDKVVADAVDDALSNLGCHVLRDERDIELWDSLMEFMKGIRKQDYVVPLVSDSFLKSENCMYEMTQLIKDDDYAKRTFPIAIDAVQRGKESLFGFHAQIDAVRFWQDKAEQYRGELDDIQPQNVSGLAMRYRRICNMAQTIDRFLEELVNRYIGVIRLPKTDDVAIIIVQAQEVATAFSSRIE